MTRKPVIVIASFGIIAGILACFAAVGVRHEKTGASQNLDYFVAVRRIERWTFFGNEFYAKNTLGLYDSTTKLEPGHREWRSLQIWGEELPEPIGELSIQIRRHGIIEFGDDQFMLGEADGYRQEDCIAYMLNVLAKSEKRDHRLFAASSITRELPGDLGDQTRKLLLADPDDAVRTTARSHLLAQGMAID